MRDDGDHDGDVDVRVLRSEAHPDGETIKEVMDEGGQQIQVPCWLLTLEALQAQLLYLFWVFFPHHRVLLFLFDCYWFVRELLIRLMMMGVTVLVPVVALSPVMVDNPEGLEKTFNYEEEQHCADEDEGNQLAVSALVRIGVREDVDNCVSDDGSAAERVEHVDEDHEGLGGDEVADADKEEGCDEAQEGDGESHQEAIDPRLLSC